MTLTGPDLLFTAAALAAVIFLAYAAYRWIWAWAVVIARAAFAVWFALGALIMAWEYGRPVLQYLLDSGQIALPFLEQGVRNL